MKFKSWLMTMQVRGFSALRVILNHLDQPVTLIDAQILSRLVQEQHFGLADETAGQSD